MSMTKAAGPRRITVLGSTGSIGCNTLDVLNHLGGRDAFEVVAITGHSNVELLAAQARACHAGLAVTADPARYRDLKAALSGTAIECAAGEGEVVAAAGRDSDIVMSAIVGIAGLAPTLAAARAGADIALANKECLVCAGDLFKQAIADGGGRLLPVDSEHNAIDQCLATTGRDGLERILLTASGGPFRTLSLAEMAEVTPERAAAHPNWTMGLKISIDSATMFNKALEMIEAMHLFAVPPSAIEVVIHPQSVIHSMVGYRDGSVLAQLGAPDMRTAIGYALAYPDRPHLPVERLDFTKLARLDFAPPDEVRFPALRLARDAMGGRGLMGAVLNGAKEIALAAFIERRIGFLAMSEVVERTMDRLAGVGDVTDVDAVFAADRDARAQARREIGAMQSAA